MKTIWIVIASLLLVSFAYGAAGEELAARLGIDPSSRAIKQWERVFDTPRKMARYGIDKLSEQETELLKEYLLDHAADSDRPIAAGL